MVVGVGLEAEIAEHAVEFGEQSHAIGVGASERDLRDRIAGHHEGEKECRDGVGEDQNAVLGDLGVGDPLHAAEDRVEEDQAHADHDPEVDVDLEETTEDHADAAHLPCDVGEGDEDGTDHRDDPRDLRVVPITHEVRDGELAELAQVGREQQGQQDVPTGPAHQVDRAVHAGEGDDAGHRDEARGAHPVGGGRHAVGQRRDALAGDVELTRRAGTGGDGDPDVEGERHTDDEKCPGLNVHHSVSSTPKRRSRRFIAMT